jgi:phenylalanyl-tRNA synthetase beta chain
VPASVAVGAIEAQIRGLSRSDRRLSTLRELRLFDVYRAPEDSSKVAGASANALLNKEKSLAFRVILQDTARALTDEDANLAVAAVVEVIEQRFGGRLRG